MTKYMEQSSKKIDILDPKDMSQPHRIRPSVRIVYNRTYIMSNSAIYSHILK